MRVVFMGTPGFAVGTLKALLEAGHDVAAVVTQPDKPKGRGKELLMTPVKAEAVKHDIPVFQPERVRKNEEFLEELKKLAPDVIVVVAFGQLLPVSVLTLPKYGCVNVHASLLPMSFRSDSEFSDHPPGNLTYIFLFSLMYALILLLFS